MEDRSSQGSQVLANVVRDFVGSRLERQLLAQAFELASHGSRSAGESVRTTESVSRLGGSWPAMTASAAASSVVGA
jgi:hypothetical protein